jgi:hypothetical protein
VDALPLHWEARNDSMVNGCCAHLSLVPIAALLHFWLQGRVFFVNHSTQQTTWTDPRSGGGGGQPSVMSVASAPTVGMWVESPNGGGEGVGGGGSEGSTTATIPIPSNATERSTLPCAGDVLPAQPQLSAMDSACA